MKRERFREAGNPCFTLDTLALRVPIWRQVSGGNEGFLLQMRRVALLS